MKIWTPPPLRERLVVPVSIRRKQLGFLLNSGRFGAAPSIPHNAVIDTFTGTDGVDLPTYDGRWTQVSGVGPLEIQGNACCASAGNTPSACYINTANYGPKCEVYGTIGTLPSDNEVVLFILRYGEGTGNGYAIYYTRVAGGANDTIQVHRLDAGVGTGLGSASTQEISAGDALMLRSDGSSHQMYYKPSGGSWATLGSAETDGTHTGAGRIAPYTNSNVVRIDDFGGGTVP